MHFIILTADWNHCRNGGSRSQRWGLESCASTKVAQTKTRDLTSDLPSKDSRLDLDSRLGTCKQSSFREIIVSDLYFIISNVWHGWWQAERNITSRMRAATDIKTSLTMAAKSSSGTVPYVVTVGYKAFTQTANKQMATCKVCGIMINDAGSTTSNFIRHLKTHKDISLSR